MQALNGAATPSKGASYAALLLYPRRGLQEASAMPRIERALEAVTVDRRWLAAYRASVGLPAQPEAALPPLALQLAAAPLHLAILADRRFPFRALGLVHVAQTVVQDSAVDASARLDLSAFTTQALRVRRGMSFGLVTEAHIDGRRVWRAETTALAIDRSLPAESAQREAAPAAAAEPASETLLQQETTLQLAESLGRRYAAIAGDWNPIHQHAWLARPFGLRRAIIHGTWTLARALAAAALPSSGAYRLEARFRRPVELPSSIVVRSYTGALGGRTRIEVSSPDGALVHASARVIGS